LKKTHFGAQFFEADVDVSCVSCCSFQI